MKVDDLCCAINVVGTRKVRNNPTVNRGLTTQPTLQSPPKIK